MHVDMSSGVQLVDLPTFQDDRGSLSVLEGLRSVPFSIARVYYVYGVPKGLRRGGHAHIQQEELIIALRGSFTVVTDDGIRRSRFVMESPAVGLYLGRLVWRDLELFSSDAVCLVASSGNFDENDYVSDYGHFREVVLTR
jgi:hypothetical protein